MSPTLTLYGIEMSPPVRAVQLTLKALNLDYTFQTVDTHKGEHLTPEYLKKSPQHKIPTLEDDGKFLGDSHAICAYLVRKYGKTDELYPKDYYQRAVVDQRLHHENGVIFIGCIRQVVAPLAKGDVSKEQFAAAVKSVHEVYDVLETFLGDNQYMAGSGLTIADFSIVTSVSSLVFAAPLEAGKHPKLKAWLERMQQLPYYEAANGTGAKKIQALLHDTLAKLK